MKNLNNLNLTPIQRKEIGELKEQLDRCQSELYDVKFELRETKFQMNKKDIIIKSYTDFIMGLNMI